MAGTMTVPAGKKRRRRRLTQRKVAPYIFLTPAFLFFCVFFLFPIVFSFYITFYRWDMLRPLSRAKFMGWKHYEYLLTRDEVFVQTLGNTFKFAFGTIFFTVAISLVLAFVFSRSRGKVIWRTIYWLPMVTTVVAIAQLWKYLFEPVYGPVNVLLGWFGLIGPNWLGDPKWAMASVIIVSVWGGLGSRMLIFSAGLEGIDESYYEAARVDGATTWQEFRHITIPLLKPTLMFIFITGFIGGLSGFALILVMTSGGPIGATRVTALYMYDMAFEALRMGRASAAAYILFAIIFVITLIQLRIFRQGGVESY